MANLNMPGPKLPKVEIPIPGSDLVNPLTSQFGNLSVQDKAFLDAFNRQEQQELHGVPRPGPVDPTTLLGQLEQVTSQITQNRLQRQSSVQSSTSSNEAVGAGTGTPGTSSGSGPPRHHEIVAELTPEEVRIYVYKERSISNLDTVK